MSEAKELFNAIIEELRDKRFYGTLEVHFQNGRVVRVKKHETILTTDPQNTKEQ